MSARESRAFAGGFGHSIEFENEFTTTMIAPSFPMFALMPFRSICRAPDGPTGCRWHGLAITAVPPDMSWPRHHKPQGALGQS